ncbi:MAG: NUDIX domain-containing protein [Candidatus Aenigmarchaeota archaeon]|nr:NUDIX domain-containing protein [Candidatus Aenigmarchaeota archaeon]
MKERQCVKLVVYVFLLRHGKILLGKRKNIFGYGHYSTPAGHMERGESVIECAKRELFEETGLVADKFEFRCVRLIRPYKINGEMADPYVAFCVEAKKWKNEPRNIEPNKNEGWGWHPLNKLPNPMFPPVKMLAECNKKSIPFID